MHGNAALLQLLRQNDDQVNNSLALQKKIQEDEDRQVCSYGTSMASRQMVNQVNNNESLTRLTLDPTFSWYPLSLLSKDGITDGLPRPLSILGALSSKTQIFMFLGLVF